MATTTVGTLVVTLTLGTMSASAADWAPIAYWHMDERSGTTMADTIGDHAGARSDVEMGLSGRAGGAYGFDGESSYASVPSASTLNPRDRDIRLTLWLKTRDRPSRPDWDLLKKGYFDRSPGLYKVEYQPDGRASCGFLGTEGSAEVTGGPDLADGDWHRVTCTKTARSIGLTIDGQPVATQDAEIGEITNTDDLVVGAYRTRGSNGHFLGMLDEVIIEMADGNGRDSDE